MTTKAKQTWIDDAAQHRIDSLENQRDTYREWIETFDPEQKRHSEVADWARRLEVTEHRLEEARIIIAYINGEAQGRDLT